MGMDAADKVELAVKICVPLIGLGVSCFLTYKLLENVNPTGREKSKKRAEALQKFKDMGINLKGDLTDYEACIASTLLTSKSLATSWTKIGGLQKEIAQLQNSVMTPFLHQRPNASRLLAPPKGVLFHGPPGCGKTLLAKALADSCDVPFINLQINTLVNMWYGESQKLADAVFSLARKIQPCIVFIDEIDSFLSARSALDNESTRMMKTQFMALWDGVIQPSSTDRILIVAATNRPADLDEAILRRLSFKVHVPKPDKEQRLSILNVLLEGEPLAPGVTQSFLSEFASQCENMTGSDLSEICRQAAACRLGSVEDYNYNGLCLHPEDFTKAISMFKQRMIPSREIATRTMVAESLE